MPHIRTTPKAFYYAKELRRIMTPAEMKLWRCLRNHQLNGLGFRRQHAIGPYIVDFCCPKRRATIEIDGDSHASQMEYDHARTEWLKAKGWQELRFTNQDIERNIEGVLEAIAWALTPTQPPPSQEQ